MGYECKAAGSGAGNDLRVQCTLHGKLRSLDCLEDDGTGRLVCTSDRRCKTAGQTMADGDYRERGDYGTGGGYGMGGGYGSGPMGGCGGGYGSGPMGGCG